MTEGHKVRMGISTVERKVDEQVKDRTEREKSNRMQTEGTTKTKNG